MGVSHGFLHFSHFLKVRLDLHHYQVSPVVPAPLHKVARPRARFNFICVSSRLGESKVYSAIHAKVCVTACLALVFLAGCAGKPQVSPDMAKVWGYVQLQPKAGAPVSKKGASQYSDRRYKHAVAIDYHSFDDITIFESRSSRLRSQVHVVYDDIIPTTATAAPKFHVLSAGGQFRLTNNSQRVISVSSPAAKLLQTMQPAQSLDATLTLGEYRFFTPQQPKAPIAHVVVVPGHHVKVSQTGRWEMLVEPGKTRISGVHRRLPSNTVEVDLAPGEVQEVTISFGVDQLSASGPKM